MTNAPTNMKALRLAQLMNTRFMRELPVDLSTRQIGILLHIYLNDSTHSVKSLSAGLGISKPAICRALDALSREDLLKRKIDDKDRRNVFIQRTLKGTVFLSEYADIIMQALKTVAEEAATASLAEAA